ncbi:translation initiation factor IF-2 [bacterium 1xD42-87]|jgi:translation initiation factor IF-2|nr:translation initiation factor IF-2 [bacterium 1xD42-87]
MAKMKVHELAKEVDRKSKELIDFLQAKGYEVKVAQSSIEDEAIALVRKEFGFSGEKPASAVEEKPQKAEKKPQKTESSAKENAAPAAGKEKAAVNATPQKQVAENEKKENKSETPKKKRIIFVSNPHNSKMGGRQNQNSGNGQNRGGGNGRPMSNGARPVQPQNTPHKIIRPTQKPIPVTAEPYDVRQKQQQERRLEQRQQEKRENNKNMAAGTQPAAGQEKAGSAGENRRPERQGRPNYNGGQGDRKSGGAPFSGGRNGGGGDRPQRGNGGQDNRFKKNNGPKDFIAEAPGKDAEKHRDDEKRRVNQERDKRSKKDHIYEEDDAAAKNRNKAGRFIKPEKKPAESKEEQIKVITVPDTLTIKELADKMKIQPSAIIKKLFLQGQIVTLNSDISFEEAENIAIEYEIICEKEVKVDVIEELLREEEEDASTMVARPPVICVMGHVDHGKTSLLDAIRKTNVTDKEAGGITQAIGAYTVSAKGQSITFLDTPGHEAFTAMRMRGANSTDIAVLVVAADDGVMPQTVEAINHAKAAGIEIIVAVNKIDKPNANIDRVKQEMTEYELIPVDWGGSTEFVPVSAKSGEGIETLLETILLTAEILELKANPNRNARGLVIEAELDKGRGPVATVLVQKGTLHVGDFISAGASHGKVRAMIDDKGRRVKEATPSTPVEILGLSDVPSAGEVFIVHENDKSAKSYAETYMAQHKEEMLADTKTKMSLDDLFNQIQEGNLKELNLIVKADVQGSVEAVKQSLMKLSNEEVVVKCIHGGVGAINESDVSLASASSAIIIGFNVRPDAQAKTVAEREGVDVRLYKVIYQAIEDIEAAMKGMLDPIFEEKVIGHAEVRQIFKASAIGNIAGSYVLDGEFQRGCKIRIRRGEEQIYEGELASLKRFKDDVKEVKAGFECGLVFEGFDKMEELDIVEAYIMVEVPR